jgi:NAD(P)H dehydrogenase (quinone)
MRIAVTAATGHLGAAIVRALKEMPGITPIAVARTPGKAAALGVETRAGDYDDAAQLQAAFREVDSVLFVSGMAPPQQRIHQHCRVIDAARQAGVGHVVYTGVVTEGGGPGFREIQAMSLETERHLRESGVEFTIGRDSIYLEPDLEYVGDYVKSGRIWNSAGEGRCAYTSRSELAQAYAKLLTEPRHRGRTYTLAGPPVTQGELAGTLNAVLGTNLQYLAVPADEYRRECVSVMGEYLGGVIAGIYDGIREGALDLPSDFAEILGRPHRTVEQMIRDFQASAPA